jgi:hypothetical protein
MQAAKSVDRPHKIASQNQKPENKLGFASPLITNIFHRNTSENRRTSSRETSSGKDFRLSKKERSRYEHAIEQIEEHRVDKILSKMNM